MIIAKPTLTGTQKVAVVLMNMDQDSAAKVMRQFTEIEAEDIASEIVRLRRVDSSLADDTLAEFHSLAMRGTRQPRGGRAFATGLLEASFGVDKATDVMARVASSMAGKAFEFLDMVDPAQIATLLDGELSETGALVLAHLRPEQASAVMSGMPAPARTDVAQCIATMGTASPETIGIIAEALKLRVGAVSSPRETLEVIGGVQPLVEIINRADVATERALLEGLDERDPALAEEVRSRMLTFADIVRLEDRDVQQVLRSMEVPVLAKAMKGSTEAVIATIKRNLSDRNREILDDEISSAGPVRMSQVEDARAEIVRTIRDLEAQGTITVTRGDEDQYVD